MGWDVWSDGRVDGWMNGYVCICSIMDECMNVRVYLYMTYAMMCVCILRACMA